MFFMVTGGTPGTQGPAGTGVQGIGVNTPRAAAVAAATDGFARLVHIAKGITFMKGMLSIMVAAGCFAAFTQFVGKITREDGAVPKEHAQTAPLITCNPIAISPFLLNHIVGEDLPKHLFHKLPSAEWSHFCKNSPSGPQAILSQKFAAS